MSFISKLKPRIKPRLGIKVADGNSTDASIPISNTNTLPINVSATSTDDPQTSPPTSSLDKYGPSSVASNRITCTGHRTNDSKETSAPLVKVISNKEERTGSNVPSSPENSVDLNPRKLETPDSTDVNKPKEVIITIQKKPKPKIMGLQHCRPVIKKQIKPTFRLESQVNEAIQPAANLESHSINIVQSSESIDIATPCVAGESVSSKNDSELVEELSELLDFSKNSPAQKTQNGIDNLVSVNDRSSPLRSNDHCSEPVNVECVKLQTDTAKPKPLDITPALKTNETTEIKELGPLDNQVKCGNEPPKSSSSIEGNKLSGNKKHSLIRRPPMIMRKAPKLDRSRTSAFLNPEKSPLITVDPSEKVSVPTNDEQKIITTFKEPNNNDVQDVENVSYNSIPIIDTTKTRNQTSSDISPLSTVSSNTDNVTSDSESKCDTMDDRELSNKSIVDKTKSGPSTKNKSSKIDAEDVRTLYAISAVDYLRRHDHALGDSIIRRLIIGVKNMQNRNLKATMCSSCNPQTLQKCLASLWSFHKDELQVILKKSAERQKAPMTFANFSGKPSFKPSLGRQRAPTMTASTYGKMCFEVKEGLAKKYGLNAPELTKLRMLDLIFYNPSNNPMSKPSGKNDPAETSTKKSSSSSSSSTSSSRSRQTSSSESTPSDSHQNDSDPDDPEDDGEGTNSTSCSSPVDDGEQNSNSVPVPQVKIGDEGQIILAPESLVMKQQESEILTKPVIHEHDFAGLVRKKDNLHRTSWSFEETVKFYKSLHGMGTDFSSMLTHFPNRTRKNLKAKFKREERKNSALIDKVLSAQGQNLSMADVEKDLAADKTLRRLCIETAPRKYPPSNSIGSVLKPSRRKKRDYLAVGGDEPSDWWKASRGEVKTPVLASSIPDIIRPRTASLQKILECDTDKTCSKKESDENKEETTTKNVPADENSCSKETPVMSDTNKSGDTFKKPVGRPLAQRKRKIDKTVPNIIKRARKCKPKEKLEEPPRIHTIFLDDVDSTDEDDDESGGLAECDPLAIVNSANRDDCFVIETNYEHESFNCVKSVKFSVDNPDWPVDVNATIEHKGPSDEPLTEIESVVDESGELIQVVAININQLPSYLEQTGAVVIEAGGS